MFQDPNLIYLVAKQKQEELLAEMEMSHKLKSSASIVKKKNKILSSIMLQIAELFIAIGVSLKKRFGKIPEGAKDIFIDLSEH